MKKIELNNVGRKVLEVLTWLITLSVVSFLGISGTGWFGALTFYALVLFLGFVYFNDEGLQATIKKSLVVAIIFVVASLLIVTYSNALTAFGVEQYDGGNLSVAYRIAEVLEFVLVTVKYVVCSVFILLGLFAKDGSEAVATSAEATEEAVEESKEETEE